MFTLCGVEPCQVEPVTPHAMKSTMLSWAAKFGISADYGKVLGYHVVPAERSMNVYARDSLAPSLRELVSFAPTPPKVVCS
eukprot:3513125-Amphidinium_carterae.2